jgi:hypothetical protein
VKKTVCLLGRLNPWLLASWLVAGSGNITAGQAPSVAYADAFGAVEALVHTYGPFDLKANTLQLVPPRMEISFPEDLWLVGYHTEIVDQRGRAMAKEFQCHTFLGTSLPKHHTHDQVVGLFSDGYTSDFRLPPGFGILMKAGEKVYWTPMFNNRNPDIESASMHITLDVIRARNARVPLQPLSTTFRTVGVPDLYYVNPGTDIRETAFTLPFAGRIHAMGTHIHPYGVSIEMINLTREETVWRAVGSRDAAGKLTRMPVYTNHEGYAVRAGDRFRLVARYENPTDHPVDAMAGVFILYVPEAP